MPADGPVAGSFRDPLGFVYRRDGRLYRQLSPAAEPTWRAFVDSGLYDELQRDGLLVPHEEAGLEVAADERAWKVLAPEELPFVSFPYEWSVGQLVDAARLTLELQARAIAKGLVLRDASAYNVQMHRGRPVFIDTLSFGAWEEGTPWVAYSQFCRHFLAPLALSRYIAPSLRSLLRVHLDGVPLPLASRLLPASTWLRFNLVSHLHLHARATERFADAGAAGQAGGGSRGGNVSRAAMLGMVDSLRAAVEACDTTPTGTEWGAYYDATNYSDEATRNKEQIVRAALAAVAPAGGARTVWDLGANTGRYSRIAAEAGAAVVAFDIDEAAVDLHWRARKQATDGLDVLPLLADLTNPSPALGWAHEERPSMTQRGPADVALALALVHHLAISNNTPLPKVAAWFSRLAKGLVIEWVPKEDSQVRRLLATREDVFPDYTREGFERAFSEVFQVVSAAPVGGSERWIYALTSRAW